MSELLQAGQHPDADQLNAFVEHALPAHEQQQTLAHLAVCPACRQIVALSLPAADQSPIPEPEPVRHRWFPRWHPAWAGIPALAALILVVLFVRNERKDVPYTSVLSQMADTRKPAPPPLRRKRSARTPQRDGVLWPSKRQGRGQLPRQAANAATPSKTRASKWPAGGVMGGILGGIGTTSSPPTQSPMPGTPLEHRQAPADR